MTTPIAVRTAHPPGQVVGVEAKDGASITALVLDADAARLDTVSWVPGSSISVRSITLDAAVDPFILSAGVTERFIAISDGHRQALVERATGSVHQLPEFLAPGVFSPDGGWLISATADGLLRTRLGTPPAVYEIQPMLLARLDNPVSVAVIPGKTSARFTVAVGCYGSVDLVDVGEFGAYPTDAGSRQVSPEGLPYDPVHISVPTALKSSPTNYVFVTDESRAALSAVHLASGLSLNCPFEARNYGTVGPVVPSLDGEACLVATRDGMWWRWTPGSPPHPQPPPGGRPLLWHADRVLVWHEATFELRDESVPDPRQVTE